MALTLIAKPSPRTVIIVPRQHYHILVRELLVCGCFHPSGHGDERLKTAARRLRGEIEILVSRLREVASRIGEEEAEAKIRIGSDPDRSLAELVSRIADEAEKIEALVSRLVELTTPGTELWKTIELLRLYSFLDVDLEKLRKAAYIRARIYRVPVKQATLVESELEKLESVVYARLAGIEKDHVLYAVVYPTMLEQQVESVARRLRLQELAVPQGLPANIAEAVKRISEELAKLPSEAAKHRGEVSRALRALEAAIEVLRIIESSRLGDTVAIVDGYASSRDVAKLASRLDRVLKGSYVMVIEVKPVPEEAEEQPTEYEYPSLLRPFAELIEMYGHPKPREIVPLALTAITLPIVFGMMFPDLGHGLVLLGFALALLLRGGEQNRWLGLLVLYMSIGAITFGFMAGEFFGADPRIAGWLTELWGGKPPYSSPVHPLVEKFFGEGHAELELVGTLVMKTIFISLGLGSFLLMVASWLGVAGAWVRGETEHLVAAVGRALTFTGVFTVFLGAGTIAGWEGYKAIAPILVTATGVPMELEYVPPEAPLWGYTAIGLAILGLAITFLAPVLFGHGEGIGMRLIDGVMEVFDTILLAVGNTISFVRIMGLMLAHSSLVFGFLLIGLNAGPAYPLVYALGNLIALGLESLIATAHSLRLHFYEMYSKFYEGGGVAYTPARLPRGVIVEVA